MHNFQSADIPKDHICPITQQLMHDPVIAADGHSYEKNAILTWLQTNHTISPLTGQSLRHDILINNATLKNSIDAFRVRLPAIQQEGQVTIDLNAAIKIREEKIADQTQDQRQKQHHQSEKPGFNYEEALGREEFENVMLKRALVAMQKQLEELTKEEKKRNNNSEVVEKSEPQNTIVKAKVRPVTCTAGHLGREEFEDNMLERGVIAMQKQINELTKEEKKRNNNSEVVDKSEPRNTIVEAKVRPVTCTAGHEMRYFAKERRAYGSTRFICNRCRRRKDEGSLHCPRCHYDLCSVCGPVKGARDKCPNNHELLRDGFRESSICVICQNCIGYTYTPICCPTCNFDLCNLCYEDKYIPKFYKKAFGLFFEFKNF